MKAVGYTSPTSANLERARNYLLMTMPGEAGRGGTGLTNADESLNKLVSASAGKAPKRTPVESSTGDATARAIERAQGVGAMA